MYGKGWIILILKLILDRDVWLDWERWSRHGSSWELRVFSGTRHSCSLCLGIDLYSYILVVQVSRAKISCLESCQSFHSNIMDVHISINSLCVNVLSCLSQNWSFLLWSPDLQRRNNSLSIQVNFDTQIVEAINYFFFILEFHCWVVPDLLRYLVSPPKWYSWCGVSWGDFCFTFSSVTISLC